MGVAALTVLTAENQRGVLDELEKQGIFILFGRTGAFDVNDVTHVMVRLIGDLGERQRIAYLGRKLVDGGGAGRVVVKLLAVGTYSAE